MLFGLRSPHPIITVSLLAVALTSACANDSDPADSDPEDSDVEMTEATEADVCTTLCERFVEVDCSGDDPLGICEEECRELLDGECESLVQTYYECVADEPLSSFECDGSGETTVKVGVCSDEEADMIDCFQGGGGSDTDVSTGDLEAACLDSGGEVSTQLCCGETQDWPDLCSIGACGCSPDNSREVTICECPEGECFDGERCVDE